MSKNFRKIIPNTPIHIRISTSSHVNITSAENLEPLIYMEKMPPPDEVAAQKSIADMTTGEPRE